MKLLWISESKRREEAERWSARSFPISVPECAARTAIILAERLNCALESLSLHGAFKDCAEFNELTHVQLLLDLEKDFDISIPDEDAADLNTPASIIAYIEATQSTCPKVQAVSG